LPIDQRKRMSTRSLGVWARAPGVGHSPATGLRVACVLRVGRPATGNGEGVAGAGAYYIYMYLIAL